MVDETEYITLKAGTIHHAGGCSVKVVEDFGGGGVALSSTRPPRELERKVARAELVTPYILFVV